MTDDFGVIVKTLLNEHVDRQLGPRRPAPSFDPHRNARPSPRPRRRWLTPLLAAACVLAVVAVTLSVTHVISDRNHTSPGTSRHSVALDGASISLPVGMVAVRDDDGSDPRVRTWCLGEPGSAPRHCQAFVSERLVLAGQHVYLDPDFPGAGFGDVGVESCAGEHTGYVAPEQTEQVGTRDFGGRDSEWRLWTAHCTSSPRSWRFEQYTVTTSPAWVLFSDATSPETSSLLAGIATHSVLPAQNRPLRLADRGILRSARQEGSSVEITLDRVVVEHTATLNDDSPTFAYRLTSQMFGAAGATVGDTVEVTTDGLVTTSFRKD